MDVRGKIAIVTGGGNGIGRGISTALASNGASVVVCERSVSAAQETVADIEGMGGRAIALSVDITNSESVKMLIHAVMEEHHGIDILVNNAGIIAAPGWQERTHDTESDSLEIIETNMHGTERMVNAVVPHMKGQEKGGIVNISSIAGLKANRGHVPVAYSASKAAIAHMTKVWALMYAPHNITVNAVCPGLVWTPMWERIGSHHIYCEEPSNADVSKEPRDIFNRHVTERIPLGKSQTPEEIGNIVSFLVSDLASCITGVVLPADGGAHL